MKSTRQIPKIIGIAGTNGSGKDTVGEILAGDYGWLFVSVSEDLLAPELKRQGLPVDRQHLAALSTQWRRESGMGATIDKAFEKFEIEQGLHKLGGLAIASLRHPGEVDRLHQLGSLVVWIDAEPKVRYERIYTRGHGAKDQKTFNEFVAEEQAEMEHSGDEATLSLSGVKAKADVFIENNGTLGEFKQAINQALKLEK